jgi:hypothetical protein
MPDKAVLFHQQGAFRDLPSAQQLRSLERASRDGLQNEKIESAGKKLGLMRQEVPPKMIRRLQNLS